MNDERQPGFTPGNGERGSDSSSAGEKRDENSFGGGGFGFPPPPPKKPKKTIVWIVALGLAYMVLMGGLFTLIGTGALQFGSTDSSAEATEDAERETQGFAPIEEITLEDGSHVIRNDDHTGEPLTATELYEQNVKSVVFVVANYRQGISTGSGFVIDAKSGYILTNHHVIKDCEEISVSFVDGSHYDATLVGGDEVNDVAVLQIEAEGLRNVNTANSDQLKVGYDVLIIGNPLGDLTFSMTRGIVSAVNRSINTGEYTINTFQTDTAINSGNSGGPAFNAAGEVIGIASAKYSATGVEGIGFCIPINDAMEVARDLLAYGYVTGRPNFGISVSDSYGYEYSIDEKGNPIRVEVQKGARVVEVTEGSCAEKAGIRVGDIITKIGDVRVESSNALINEKNRYKAGDSVTVEVYRDGESIQLTVVMDEYTPQE